ncbi:helix-turn-helix domain-containing protein [Streptomyces marincola]|uniref:helix-turn-helix domain-containing protein n=1 Tax=Streptomyces marincola TaxID=2878388 RepID=UPI001CF3734F|nr:helix-turn-helix transcriptional regulator [Streptomyces marincola]UCM88095.1 helix-turn-helix domain-containing protein [Streptomyces marincola]
MSPDGGTNEDVERLGSLIRRLREDAGMSQGELAAAAERHQPRSHGGLDIGQISRWEREVRLIGPYWLPAMAEALGVPEERLRRARAASKAARRRVRGPQPTGVDAVLRDLLPPDEPLAAVETRAGARVGMRDADRILRRAHALRLADDLVAGGDLVDAAMRELNAARELFNAGSHSEIGGLRTRAHLRSVP